jgi:TonB family protein
MVITIQNAIKQGYAKLLWLSLVLSFVTLTNLFLFTPRYAPHPYALEEEIFEVVEVPDNILIPPPPQEVEMPRIPVQFEISNEVSDDATIDDSSFEFPEDIPLPVTNSPGNGPNIFRAYDEAPIPIYKAPVHYPQHAREAEMEGVVNVLIHVDPHGNVFDVQVLSATVPRILQDEAVLSARKWRFKPGSQRNKPVATIISAAILFTLRGH